MRIGNIALGLRWLTLDGRLGWKVRALRAFGLTLFLAWRPFYRKPKFIDPLADFWGDHPSHSAQGAVQIDRR